MELGLYSSLWESTNNSLHQCTVDFVLLEMSWGLRKGREGPRVSLSLSHAPKAFPVVGNCPGSLNPHKPAHRILWLNGRSVMSDAGFGPAPETQPCGCHLVSGVENWQSISCSPPLTSQAEPPTTPCMDGLSPSPEFTSLSHSEHAPPLEATHTPSSGGAEAPISRKHWPFSCPSTSLPVATMFSRPPSIH